MTSSIDPLQGIWDAWTPVKNRVWNKPPHYFPSIIQLQLIEILNHDNTKGKANEVVDIISICINWLRWMNYDKLDDIAELIWARVKTRYSNQATEILDKYYAKYGL